VLLLGWCHLWVSNFGDTSKMAQTGHLKKQCCAKYVFKHFYGAFLYAGTLSEQA
jgi:hypothetical protein